jgi:hypothetical protein
MSLSTYDDLAAPSASDSSRTVAERCVERMKDAAAPMPPGGLLDPGAVAVLERWVAAGMQRATCSQDDPGVVCSSNVFFRDVELENEGARGQMFPGRACIACHTGPGEEEGPAFLVAGTVYPTAHEPADCYGVTGARIVVTDVHGRAVTLASNSAGNFYYEDDPGVLVPPFNARLEYGGRTRAMVQAVASGDCNRCHTQDGFEGAPGRIQLP